MRIQIFSSLFCDGRCNRSGPTEKPVADFNARPCWAWLSGAFGGLATGVQWRLRRSPTVLFEFARPVIPSKASSALFRRSRISGVLSQHDSEVSAARPERMAPWRSWMREPMARERIHLPASAGMTAEKAIPRGFASYVGSEAENRTSPAHLLSMPSTAPSPSPANRRYESRPRYPLRPALRRDGRTAARIARHKRIGPAKAGPMLKVSAKPSKVSDAAVDQDGNARMHQSMIGFQARPSANSASALTPNTTRSGRSSLGGGILPSGSSKYIALITRR